MYEVTAAAFFILEYLRKAEIFLKDMENNELMRVHCGGRYKPIVPHFLQFISQHCDISLPSRLFTKLFCLQNSHIYSPK